MANTPGAPDIESSQPHLVDILSAPVGSPVVMTDFIEDHLASSPHDRLMVRMELEDGKAKFRFQPGIDIPTLSQAVGYLMGHDDRWAFKHGIWIDPIVRQQGSVYDFCSPFLTVIDAEDLKQIELFTTQRTYPNNDVCDVGVRDFVFRTPRQVAFHNRTAAGALYDATHPVTRVGGAFLPVKGWSHLTFLSDAKQQPVFYATTERRALRNAVPTNTNEVYDYTTGRSYFII